MNGFPERLALVVAWGIAVLPMVRAQGLGGSGSRLAGPATALKSAYAGRFAIGAAIPGTGLNPAERRILLGDFNTVTPENCMKPISLHPQEARYAFQEADALVEMARANGLTVNAHALVWHNQCPEWFFLDGGKPAGRDLVLKRMRDHIAAVGRHFAGKVTSWDVVNEAIADGKDELRQTKWLTTIGKEFIAEAFIAARKADPKAELYYNDYNIERQPKRDKTLRLIRELKQAGAPIQGIGIQGHWSIDRIPYQDIEDAIVAFHAEGMQVAISELDIDVVGHKSGGDPFAKGLPADMQQRLADQYGQLFALFLKHHDKISRVTFWGLHDGRSWLNTWPSVRTNHPLLWDRNLKPKPARVEVLGKVNAEKLKN